MADSRTIQVQSDREVNTTRNVQITPTSTACDAVSIVVRYRCGNKKVIVASTELCRIHSCMILPSSAKVQPGMQPSPIGHDHLTLSLTVICIA